MGICAATVMRSDKHRDTCDGNKNSWSRCRLAVDSWIVVNICPTFRNLFLDTSNHIHSFTASSRSFRCIGSELEYAVDVGSDSRNPSPWEEM
jgi:hypothetical protein